MEKKDLFMVWSPNYGAWLFTTSDKAWKFMEDAICLLGNKTTWNIDKTPEEVIKSWHHPWELCILERIDKNVEDLKKLVEEVDKNFEGFLKQMYGKYGKIKVD